MYVGVEDAPLSRFVPWRRNSSAASPNHLRLRCWNLAIPAAVGGQKSHRASRFGPSRNAQAEDDASSSGVKFPANLWSASGHLWRHGPELCGHPPDQGGSPRRQRRNFAFDGLEAAARRAKDAAADKDVWVLGADIARHLLRAGLLDVVVRDPPALPRLEALTRDVAREPPSTRGKRGGWLDYVTCWRSSRIGRRAETVWRSQPGNASGIVIVEIGIYGGTVRDLRRAPPH